MTSHERSASGAEPARLHLQYRPASRAAMNRRAGRRLFVGFVGRLQRRLRRRQPGNGDAERRAGNIVEADLLAELDRGRVAAVLAADAELQPEPGLAAALGGKGDQLTDALAVERDEGIAG